MKNEKNYEISIEEIRQKNMNETSEYQEKKKMRTIKKKNKSTRKERNRMTRN